MHTYHMSPQKKRCDVQVPTSGPSLRLRLRLRLPRRLPPRPRPRPRPPRPPHRLYRLPDMSGSTM